MAPSKVRNEAMGWPSNYESAGLASFLMYKSGFPGNANHVRSAFADLTVIKSRASAEEKEHESSMKTTDQIKLSVTINCETSWSICLARQE